jgi:hypothetical protein
MIISSVAFFTATFQALNASALAVIDEVRGKFEGNSRIVRGSSPFFRIRG